MIVVDQGANGLVDPASVAADLPSAIYYLAQLETPVAAIRSFFSAGRANGVHCVLNAAPANLAAKPFFSLCVFFFIY